MFGGGGVRKINASLLAGQHVINTVTGGVANTKMKSSKKNNKKEREREKERKSESLK